MTSAGAITIGHYILGKISMSSIGKSLGKGTFGLVKQGTHTLTGEKVKWCFYCLGSSKNFRERKNKWPERCWANNERNQDTQES